MTKNEDNPEKKPVDSNGNSVSQRFIDHAISTKNIGTLEYASGRAKGSTDCGDAVEVQLRVSEYTIADIKCIPQGCLNIRACADALAELVKGKRIEMAQELEPEDVATELDQLPEDHMHCAQLVVDTLREAINDYSQRNSYWAQTRRMDKLYGGK